MATNNDSTGQRNRTSAKKDAKPPIKLKIEFDFPIDIDGVSVTEKEMRRPKVKDELLSEEAAQEYYKVPNPSDPQIEIILLSNLTGIPPDSIENMYSSDYQKMLQVYRTFLSSIPPAR